MKPIAKSNDKTNRVSMLIRKCERRTKPLPDLPMVVTPHRSIATRISGLITTLTQQQSNIVTYVDEVTFKPVSIIRQQFERAGDTPSQCQLISPKLIISAKISSLIELVKSDSGIDLSSS
jgi:hypothetical protein